MRRLDSVTRSPLYSLYGETIAGVSVVRAFGACECILLNLKIELHLSSETEDVFAELSVLYFSSQPPTLFDP